jgi:hypothetical protein
MNARTSIGQDDLFPRPEPVLNREDGRRWRVVRRIGGAGVAGLVALVVAMGIVRAVRESHRKQCADHLKRLGLALVEYQEVHGHFPAPALARSDGTPLLSWRVALLPHLGYRSLYERFHRDESWDSPHNRALLAEMPIEFACPGGPERRAGRTGYQVVVGPKTEPSSLNTASEPTRGVDPREITDGTSNTVLVFETDALVPWTKPDDLHWARGGPLPRLSSPHPGGTHAIFADMATRFLKSTIGPEILLALLTINGGELTGG